MFKSLCFTAAILVSANAFAACPAVQTEEQVIKSVEHDFQVFCGLNDPKTPNVYMCIKNIVPIQKMQSTDRLKQPPISAVRMTDFKSLIVEVSPAESEGEACEGMQLKHVELQF
jgi:hypothetical protein